MKKNLLTEEQRDALQEVANIGMGQAGDSIARALNEFVQLSIPRVLILEPEGAMEAVRSIVGNELASAVSQGFHGGMRGEAIVIYRQSRCNDLAELMGYDELDRPAERELLLDVTNMIVGACLRGVAGQLHADVGFSSPVLIADQVPTRDLKLWSQVETSEVLFMEVNFSLERRSFACHLIILMPEEELGSVRQAVDRFIGSY